MTHPLSARIAALLGLADRTATPSAASAAAAGASLASLNRARRTVPHPSTPAYRLRRPAGRPGRPFPADPPVGVQSGAPASGGSSPGPCEHQR